MNEREIFLTALQKTDAVDRATFLDQACPDPNLRRQIEALLAEHERLGSFLENAAVRLPAPPEAEGNPESGATVEQSAAERPGTMIGPYKLLEQIGEGGFGVVYMAEQTEPVRRKVALKILKPGMDTRQVIGRFEAERQALAIMDHPNIAKVYDGGSTGEPSRVSDRIEDDAARRLTPLGSPRPYFVMELVKGVPITEFCDQQKLSTRQRLDLFLPVCQAVQHAHQKGIIHRDLKPSNILVVMHDTTPVPKVIDFGIAKALGQELTDKTLFTGFAQMVGTPLYMSPEQAGQSGLDIDTRSDIYSLGVLLYELLTGTTPFDKERFKQAAYDEIRRIIREEDPPKPSTRLSDSQDSLPSISAQRQTEPAKLTKLVRGELDWIVMKALEKDRSRRYETANGFAMDVQRYLADEPVQACPPSAAYRFRKFVRRNKAGVAVAALVLFFLVLLGSGIGWAVRDRAGRQAKVAGQVELIIADVDRLEREQKWPEALAMARRAGAAVATGEADEETAQHVHELLKDLEFIDRLEETRMQHAALVEGKFDYAETDRKYARAFRDYGVDIDELAVETSIERLKGRPALAIPLAGALDEWRDVRSKISEQHAAGCGRLVAVARGVDPEPLRDQIRSIGGQPASKGEELRRLARSINIRAHHPANLVSLAVILARSKDSEFALRLLRDAQSVYPGDFWLNFELAAALRLQKDYEGAARYTTAAVAIRPTSAAAHNNLGLALGDQNRLEEAVICLSKAIELDPKLVAAHHNLANILLRQKKLDQALVAIHKAIELDPNYAKTHYSLGRILREQKKLDEALAAYRKAVEIDPTFANAYVGLGNSLRGQKKLDEALASYGKAIELDPQNAFAFNLLGIVLQDDQKKHADAVAAFRKVIELDPKFPSGHVNLGLALQGQRKLDEASAAFRKAIEIDPRDVKAHYCLGAILSEHFREYANAAACFRKAIELEPKHAGAYSGIGIALRGQNKVDEAIVAYRKAIELDPNNATSHNGLGTILCDIKQDYDAALASFLRAIELKPDYVEAWTNRGHTHARLKQHDEAIVAYRKAIELDPKDAKAHNGLGAILCDIKQDYDGALASFLQAIEIKPDYVQAWTNRGNAHARLKQHDEAIAAYRKAIDLAPKSASAHNGLGISLQAQGKMDDAIAAYRKAIEVSPNLLSAHLNLVRGLKARGKTVEAIAAAEEMVRLLPKSAPAANDFAWLLATGPDPKLRDAPRAVELAKKAVELAPMIPAFERTLGVAHYRAGNCKEAVATLEKSMELRKGGDGFDWFFLAMARWQLGDKQTARKWYAQAVEWTVKNQPRNEELRRIRAEATELLGIEKKKD